MLLIFAVLESAALALPLDPGAYASLAVSGAPTGTVTINTTTLTWTDATGPDYVGVLVGNVCVFTFDQVNLATQVNVSGSRPVAILSKGDLTLSGDIQAIGAGYAGNSTAPLGGYGAGPGGGMGGQPACGGAFGGAGGCPQPDAAAYGDVQVALDFGSGGGRDVDAFGDIAGDGGDGGGAVELGALGALTVTATGSVDVSGTDGYAGQGSSGGGGGAGGAVFLHGSSGTCDGSLTARGANGGANYYPYGEFGGGGAGGRIAVIGLSTACDVDVGRYHEPYTCPFPGEAGQATTTDRDTDGDGGGDVAELTWGTDPTVLDTDGGGVWDRVEVELLGTDPLDPTDDACDVVDADADGLGDVCDLCPSAFDPGQGDWNGDGVGDACDAPVALTVDKVAVAAVLDARVVNARGGDEITLLISRGNLGAGPCPAELGGLCLDLTHPKVLARATADGLGNAAMHPVLPASFAANDPVSFQVSIARGASGADSEVSNGVQTRVHP